MRRKFFIFLAILAVSWLLMICVNAAVPHLIRFQGKVTDKTGAPLNGLYNITLRIYDASTGGSLMWSETQPSVPVNNGIFTVLMGNVAALDLPFDQPYWISIEVNDDGEMSPRQAISSVGYAIHSEVADSISNVSVIPTGALILWRGASCPQGYTRLSELDGKFLVAGASYNSSAGGNNTHSHEVGSYSAASHTLTIGEMPSHYHLDPYADTLDNPFGYSGGSNHSTSDSADGGSNYSHTSSTGGNQGHSHSVTGTSASADSRPAFATIILCEKQ